MICLVFNANAHCLRGLAGSSKHALYAMHDAFDRLQPDHHHQCVSVGMILGVEYHVQALWSDPEIRVTVYEAEAGRFEKKAVQFHLDGDTDAAAQNLEVAEALRMAADMLRKDIEGEGLTLLDTSLTVLVSGCQAKQVMPSVPLFAAAWLQPLNIL